MKRVNKLPIEESIRVLEENLKEIDRVSEWAETCGYTNPKTFSRRFRNYFGERPSVFMKRMKVEVAIELLSNAEAEEISNYVIALEIGKRDEQALYHFMKQQTGKPPEFFKSKK